MLKNFFEIFHCYGNLNKEIIKLEFNNENIKSAYSKILKSIWDNFDNVEDLFSEKILVKIPADLHWELPNILYLKTKEFCSGVHYNWKVKYAIPEIKENTTFKDLYEIWFKKIISPI